MPVYDLTEGLANGFLIHPFPRDEDKENQDVR